MIKTLVAGHICLDMTPIFSSKTSAPTLLEPGKLIAVGPADIHPGGVVSNTGLAIQFYGAEVELLAKVGNDYFGQVIKGIFEAKKVKAKIKVDAYAPTSYSVVIARPGIDRTFLHCPGCNDTFVSEDVTDEDLKGIKLFHFGYPPLMKKMYEKNGEELLSLFKRVKAKNIATSLDLAAVDPNSESGSQDWQSILKGVLPYVDFFVPSFEELCFMLDRPKYNELVKKGGDLCMELHLTDLEELASRCLSYGAGFVMIKAGAAGMYYACSEQEKFTGILNLNQAMWRGIKDFQKSFVPEKILSGTGAGDTAIAAFLAAISKGYSAKHSAELAAASGACCLTAYDALSGLISLKKMEKKIKDGWEQQDFLVG